MSDERPAPRLYLISPPAIDDLSAFAKALPSVLAAGDVACFRLALRGEAPDEAIRAACDALIPVCQNAHCAFLVENRPDLARECGADGAHVAYGSYGRAREILGEEAIVGVGCGLFRHAAMTAAERGADYVAFSPIDPARGKEPDGEGAIPLLEWWQAVMESPCVGEDGVTLENAAAVCKGADFLALRRSVWESADPAGAVAAFQRVIDGL